MKRILVAAGSVLAVSLWGMAGSAQAAPVGQSASQVARLDNKDKGNDDGKCVIDNDKCKDPHDPVCRSKTKPPGDHGHGHHGDGDHGNGHDHDHGNGHGNGHDD